MKLIVLYGPPAAGKYTVAKGIAEKTGYRLFHNHLTVDLLKSVFTFGTENFFQLSQNIRLEILEQAAKENIPGIVFTFVYNKNNDDGFIRDLLERVTSQGGEVIFIQIYCEQEELLKRVEEESRRQFQKITSKEGLAEMLASDDLISSIDFVNGTKIDTTHLTPQEAIAQALDILADQC